MWFCLWRYLELLGGGGCCCSVAKSCLDSVTQQTATHQASLSFTLSQRLLKVVTPELVMLSNHLIFCHPLLLLPSVFPSIRVFSSEFAFLIRQPKYWSYSFSINLPMSIQGWFPLELTGLISLQSTGLSRVFSSTIQKHQFLGIQSSL